MKHNEHTEALLSLLNAAQREAIEARVRWTDDTGNPELLAEFQKTWGVLTQTESAQAYAVFAAWFP
jgi:hypothetical protein